MIKKSLILLSLLFTVSCANNMHTYQVKQGVRMDYDKPDAKSWDHFFIAGLLQESEKSAVQMCKDKGFNEPTYIVSEQRWFQSLISGLTWGIYTPRITYVWCN
jgi:hypothetical protein